MMLACLPEQNNTLGMIQYPSSSITLDDFWHTQLHERQIDIMKIDVEGFEWDVLLGGNKLFRTRPPPVLFIEYSPWNLIRSGPSEIMKKEKNGVGPQILLTKLSQYGYKLAVIANKEFDGGRIPDQEIQAVMDYPSSPGAYVDVVFVHDGQGQ